MQEFETDKDEILDDGTELSTNEADEADETSSVETVSETVIEEAAEEEVAQTSVDSEVEVEEATVEVQETIATEVAAEEVEVEVEVESEIEVEETASEEATLVLEKATKEVAVESKPPAPVEEKAQVKAEQDVPSIVQTNSVETKSIDMNLVTVSPVELPNFEDSESELQEDPKANIEMLEDVKMQIKVELGKKKSTVKKILELNKGSIVELNKVAGEQLELYANGKFVAYGEVIVIDDKFGLRVTSVSGLNIVDN